MFRTFIGTLLVSVLATQGVNAQALNAARRVEIGYLIAGMVRTGSRNVGGGCADVSVAITDSVGLMFETCATHQAVGDTAVDSLGSYRGGLRISRRLGARFTTFVQGLAGFEAGYRHTNHTDDVVFSIDAGGGVDFGLTNWLGLRLIRASYQMARVDGVSVHGLRVAPGVVLRFGRR
jgi:hypothetical protein